MARFSAKAAIILKRLTCQASLCHRPIAFLAMEADGISSNRAHLYKLEPSRAAARPLQLQQLSDLRLRQPAMTGKTDGSPARALRLADWRHPSPFKKKLKPFGAKQLSPRSSSSFHWPLVTCRESPWPVIQGLAMVSKAHLWSRLAIGPHVQRFTQIHFQSFSARFDFNLAP